jgi:Dyp-type peroxidase family
MAQQPLPPATFPTSADLKDLQGDVILGIPKRAEDFVFFTIENAANFKTALKQLAPLISSTADLQQVRKEIGEHKQAGHPGLKKVIGTNIAFTFLGLKKLGVTESLGDNEFEKGQLSFAKDLGDTGTADAQGNFDPDWIPAFKQEIDGVILIAGDCRAHVEEGKLNVEHVLGKTIKEVLVVSGNTRPDKEKGHEHFGFLDGVSLPAVPAITGKKPGQQEVPPGILVLGQPGDPVTTRPSWSKNGSFLAYRQLEQLVPEFDNFVDNNPIILPGLDRKHGSDLLGARMVGRWKSGAPIDITPLQDDPVLGADPQRNNNFDFSTVKDQTKCPFSAHVRKTNPRSDLPNALGIVPHQVMRQGIPFGPEVSEEEGRSGKTANNVHRGLAFVCYQSVINNGFQFLQEKWVNNLTFPPKKDANGGPLEVGFDPIIGTNGSSAAGRETFGTNPQQQAAPLNLPAEWVVPKGGAYFFSPPISALTGKLAA